MKDSNRLQPLDSPMKWVSPSFLSRQHGLHRGRRHGDDQAVRTRVNPTRYLPWSPCRCPSGCPTMSCCTCAEFSVPSVFFGPVRPDVEMCGDLSRIQSSEKSDLGRTSVGPITSWHMSSVASKKQMLFHRLSQALSSTCVRRAHFRLQGQRDTAPLAWIDFWSR